MIMSGFVLCSQDLTKAVMQHTVTVEVMVSNLCEPFVAVQILIKHLDLLHADKVILLWEDKRGHHTDNSTHAQRHNVASQHGVVLKSGLVCNLTVLDLQARIFPVSMVQFS